MYIASEMLRLCCIVPGLYSSLCSELVGANIVFISKSAEHVRRSALKKGVSECWSNEWVKEGRMNKATYRDK